MTFMSAAHKDTPRVGWQQQSGQFLQAPSHSSGLRYPKSFLGNLKSPHLPHMCNTDIIFFFQL
ncbi:hypothetical protein QYF61_024607 [Mycteria americana]|uniref:Uncharacterized protein n=1 Tax=Mycteria americana TaxID=33587 RepID=A0AAN7Q8J3_MYCAM|nr:hypothetical protein QYF61_024607 [Mycteria americana]